MSAWLLCNCQPDLARCPIATKFVLPRQACLICNKFTISLLTREVDHVAQFMRRECLTSITEHGLSGLVQAVENGGMISSPNTDSDLGKGQDADMAQNEDHEKAGPDYFAATFC